MKKAFIIEEIRDILAKTMNYEGPKEDIHISWHLAQTPAGPALEVAIVTVPDKPE